ncbi:MAG TPA: DUF2304 domain-containing protein [Thermoleophilia bacterium]|nr:DUF2304 domain-containing protein [Thermoleophilia bacterium]
MSLSPALVGVTFGQIVLVGLVAALGIYVFALRSVLTDRLAMLLLAAVGVLLVVWPGLSSDVAELLGIGRGTDLVFYLFIIFCLFRFVSGAAHTRRLESRLASVVREQALRNARPAAAAGSSEANEAPQA